MASFPKTGETDSYVYYTLAGGIVTMIGAIGYEALRKEKNEKGSNK